jgi:hypothetical protein
MFLGNNKREREREREAKEKTTEEEEGRRSSDSIDSSFFQLSLDALRHMYYYYWVVWEVKVDYKDRRKVQVRGGVGYCPTGSASANAPRQT